jgi:hypothetical protein
MRYRIETKTVSSIVDLPSGAIILKSYQHRNVAQWTISYLVPEGEKNVVAQ